MRMPEMNVVRFTENDVIVASIANEVTLHLFTDSGMGNSYITINDVNYGSSQSGSGTRSYDQAYKLYSNFGEGTTFSWNRGEGLTGNYTFSGMLENDGNGTAMAGADGVFYWNGSSFVYPQKQ